MIEIILKGDCLFYNSKKEGLIGIKDIQYIHHMGQLLTIYFTSNQTKKFKKLELIDLFGYQSFILSLQSLFNQIHSNNSYLGAKPDIDKPDDFKSFLIYDQQDSVDSSTPTDISDENFLEYLNSPDNSILKPASPNLHHSIHDYYISASHNTYLFGNQLSGASSTIGYIRSLLLGCRSVEIDVWNGDDGNPIVYHGHTLTQPIPFVEILTTVKNFAFVASNLPLILSVETHCDVQQQDKMAHLLINILGDSLITQKLQHDPSSLPSPEQLRNKILFKTKNRLLNKEKSISYDDYFTSSENSSSSDLEKRSFSNFIQKVTRRASASSDRSSNSSAGSPRFVDSIGNIPSNNRMSQKLLDLLIYTVGVKFRGFNKKEHYNIEHIFSLSDRSARKCINTSSAEFIKHNRNHLTRIYPHGARVKSTNFDALDYWAVGCQLIALNYQTVDLAMWFNFAMFNGNQGFVLKPSPLLHKDEKKLLDVITPVNVTFRVICGQQLPKDINQVSVEIYTPRSFNNAPLKQSTKTSTEAINPVWNDVLSFSVNVRASMTELVVVKFNLHNSQSEDIIASYAITLANIRQGYRNVPLHDAQLNKIIFSKLFVYNSIK
ncbi:PLC-like phosphodiesterase [Wallemia mellicola]|nr:PLC-like phosphodiesterase [Wallemia mellicola]